MLATVTWPQGRMDIPDAPDDESGFWRAACSAFERIPLPWKGDPPIDVEVSCPLGSATMTVRGRDPMWVDGRQVPSPAIFPAPGSEGGIPGLRKSGYGELYLTFASVESQGGRGSYKFYRLIPSPDGTIGAEYGRIGQGSGFGAPRRVKEPYPSWMYWPKATEKRLKGYVDQSDVYLDPEAREATGAEGARGGCPSGATASQRLYALLMEAARSHVSACLVQGARVTKEQVRRSRRLVYEISRRRTVEAFNRQLMRLMQVSPRRAGSVSGQMARSVSDFPRIIDREESLLAAMEAVVSDGRPREASSLPDFGPSGVKVLEASEDERSLVLSMLSERLRRKVAEVYAVDHAAQSERFLARCEGRGIEDVRMLWHGSPACNWASIVQSSLWVPGASGVAHGSMFGRGIYFGQNGNRAGSARDGGGEKSWGYAGASDSRWSGGRRQRSAWMALFDVAYGRAFEPLRAEGYDQRWLDARGYDSVHAHAGRCGLANDEIVVYHEAAVRIRYLVRFEA